MLVDPGLHFGDPSENNYCRAVISLILMEVPSSGSQVSKSDKGPTSFYAGFQRYLDGVNQHLSSED
jgi:hypothetical protein